MPVIAGDSCGYWRPVQEFENVWSLWESSNIGINGVFVYEISKLPSGILLDNSSIDISIMFNKFCCSIIVQTLLFAGIRLDKKENNRTGLVEVCHEGEWRSVCDDYWTDVDADVACRQLFFLGYGEFDWLAKPFVYML